MIPKLIIVADDARQRHALTDVSQSCGFEILHCVASRQFDSTIAQQQPDLWIIDVENEDDLLELIGFDQPMLMGMTSAPAFTEQVLYKRWKQGISRKLLMLLSDKVPILNNSVALNSALAGNAKQILNAKLLPSAWRVVLLAASMGGLEAVKAFLDKVSTDLPVIFLLVQHIDPYMQSQLPRILSRHNRWTFEVLNLHEMSLDAGKVYIVPAQHQINFDRQGRVVMQTDSWPGAYQPSITAMIHRASTVFRQQLLTIVFSGMGDDGSHSAAYQISCGGKIWAQTAESCASASQPDQMRATGQVCFNETPEGLAQQLDLEYRQSRENSSE
ncbi:hypothetical protein BKE30_04045 [Alkanindiges hydrocarboniclasticus]|jgi:chemosensory pili system protein ChpB (putative protein-glutamate methylesterase)|uniref:protein-glutamate methylesterase n=1 Tax=Alkanindiges hydrocarboniclasticus TaxID=1907941 RepID=A0A1S8CWA2_9GAMM|nr:chemotaxis protein CheB [Alkanindiges hydrocarboniclasticus]ONG41607.1 hypothetical protein BKE30_04045 [Alkanindiges hydrocarboniclasticus]